MEHWDMGNLVGVYNEQMWFSILKQLLKESTCIVSVVICTLSMGIESGTTSRARVFLNGSGIAKLIFPETTCTQISAFIVHVYLY